MHTHLLQIKYTKRFHIQFNLNSWNTDGSFIMANSNSFLSPTKFFDSSRKQTFRELFLIISCRLVDVVTINRQWFELVTTHIYLIEINFSSHKYIRAIEVWV